jgi:hypothetical protein
MQNSNNEVTQNVKRSDRIQESLRPWARPEAKIAEVAQVTLSGVGAPDGSDLGTCSS